MILSRSHLQELVVKQVIRNPNRKVLVEQVSICLHLDSQFTVYTKVPLEPFTPPKKLETSVTNLVGEDTYTLPPLGKVLGCSEEIVKVPGDIMGTIQTKGSLARGFLMAHACDGQVDPGYNGKITFEIVNLSDFYYFLKPGMPFASLFFHRLETPLSDADLYRGRYQDSHAPTAMSEPKSGPAE
jgi:dCTP deaminase